MTVTLFEISKITVRGMCRVASTNGEYASGRLMFATYAASPSRRFAHFTNNVMSCKYSALSTLAQLQSDRRSRFVALVITYVILTTLSLISALVRPRAVG